MIKASARISEMVEGRFPRLEMDYGNAAKRRITIFGLAHGHGNDFQEHSRKTKGAMEHAIGGIRPREYVLAEGFEDDLARRVVELRGHEFEPTSDHVHSAILSRYKKLRFAERFEWHSIFSNSPEELRFHESKKKALETGNAMELAQFIRLTATSPEEQSARLRDLFENVMVDDSTLGMMKNIMIRTHVHLSGLDEGIVSEIVEKLTTFRSFLAARTAFWRATLTDVNVFMGSMHAKEIVDFLLDPVAATSYANSLPDWLKGMYSSNERCQKNIMAIFASSSSEALSKKLTHIFLRWLAYQVYDAEYDLNPKMLLDYAGYRRAVLETINATREKDPCICLSGAKFSSCCMGEMKAVSGIIREMDGLPRNYAQGKSNF